LEMEAFVREWFRSMTFPDIVAQRMAMVESK
jgi:hypothetical protein